jgi:hypothetical protein
MNLHSLRCLLFGAILFHAPAMASTLFQTGFEPPTYTLGPLSGQDSWVPFGVLSGSSVVENTVTNGGAQAVSIDSTTGEQIVGRPVAFSPGNGAGSVLKMKIDMLLSTTGGQSLDWVPLAALASNGLLGAILVTGTTAAVDIAGVTAGSVTIARGVWNTYELDVDFNAQTLTGYVNGTLIGSSPISTPPGTTFEAVVLGLGSTTDSGDVGYFDNLDIFTLDSTPAGVPTLSTGGLALLGALLIGTAWYATIRRPRRAPDVRRLA